MKDKSATKCEGTRRTYRSAINALSRFVGADKHTVNEEKASVPDAIPRRRHIAWHQLSRFENGRQAPTSCWWTSAALRPVSRKASSRMNPPDRHPFMRSWATTVPSTRPGPAGLWRCYVKEIFEGEPSASDLKPAPSPRPKGSLTRMGKSRSDINRTATSSHTIFVVWCRIM